MATRACRRFRRLLPRLGKGDGAAARRLLEHARACEACAPLYERAVLALRRLSPVPDEMLDVELNALADLAIDESRSREAGPSPGARRWWPWLVPAGTAAALGVVLLLRWLPGRDAGITSPRGTGTAAHASVRAYCLAEEEGGRGQFQVVAESSAETGALRCRLSHVLQLAYTLRAPQPAQLSVIGIPRGSDDLLVYFPRSEELRSAEVAPSSRETPLPGSVRLGLRHQPGIVDVLAVVSPGPLDRAQLEQLARGGSAPGATLLRITLEIAP